MADKADIFVSCVEEDLPTVVEIVQGLEQAGYSAWYYKRDSIFTFNFLIQETQAIDGAQVFLLLISPNSIKSRQIDVEVAHAHESGKPHVPVLKDMSHDEYRASQPFWSAAGGMATSIRIPPEGVASMMPRLVAGLAAMGIVPQGSRVASDITTLYPYPLAATYARRVAAGAGREQAFQLHQGLADLAEAMVEYLAAIVVARYRKDIGALGGENADVEQDLRNLRNPTPSAWLALLNSALGLYATGPDPLMRDLHAVIYQTTHRGDAIGATAIAIQEWLEVSPRRRPPFSLQAILELLELYRERPEGWGTQGAVLAPAEYEARLDLLRPAFEAAMGDLKFLTAYPLVCARNGANGAEGPLRLYRGMGRDFVAETAANLSSRAWKGGHVFLCTAQAGRVEPYLDLHPMVVCDDCSVCGGLTVFFPSAGKDQQLEYRSTSCGHKLAAREAALRGHELWAFFSADSAGALLYLEALREVLGTGETGDDERQKLEFLAKTLNIGAELAASLEANVREESEAAGSGQIEPAPRPVLGVPPVAAGPVPEVGSAAPPVGTGDAGAEEAYETAKKTEAEPFAKPQPGRAEPATDPPTGAPDEPAQAAPQAAAATGRRFVLKWQEAKDAPVLRVALFGTPPFALALDEEGAVWVHNDAGKLIYKERIEGRVRSLAASVESVAVATWDGQLYVFGARALMWQADLASPASAIEMGKDPLGLVVGTWDGRVIAFRSNGDQLWSTQFDDGISALAVNPSATEFAVGTLAGQLALLDGTGERIWLRAMQAPVVRLVFAGHRHAVVVATRNSLTQVDVDNQGTVWDSTFDKRIDDFVMVGGQSRLAVSTDRCLVQLFSANGDLHKRGEHGIPALAQLLPLPLPTDEHMLLGLSLQDGLMFVDGRGAACVQDGPVATCAAVSTNGREAILGNAEGVALYRLAKPDLKAKLAPVGDLVQGRFNRLKVTICNTGERAAKEIALAFDGPVECDPEGLATELESGSTATSEQQSIRFMAAGAVPVTVVLRYTDEWGIGYESRDRHVWDVAAKGG